MTVGFAFVDHVHDLIGAGDKTLSASLRHGRKQQRDSINIVTLMQHTY